MSAANFNLGETSLLLAVRDQIRLQGFGERECDVEQDEITPATVGQKYLIVMPGGYSPGPRHRSSGGVNDVYYSVSIAIIKRITNVPKDRRRDIFLNNLGSMNDEVDKIFAAVDFSYDVLQAANAIILAKTASAETFTEPLRFTGIDPKPRPAPADLFSATGETAAGLVRSIHFGYARRVTSK